MTEASPLRSRELALTVGGPAIVGALLALPFGLVATARGAAQLPAVLIGVTLLMLPALYICASLNGFQLTTRRLLEAGQTALYRMGLVLLGFAPALLFIGVSSETPKALLIVAPFAVRIAAAIGVRAIFPLVFEGSSGLKSKVVFAAWAFVGLGIAESLYSNLFEAV
jgi:hypothetical protein